jgi:hypothetical protein
MAVLFYGRSAFLTNERGSEGDIQFDEGKSEQKTENVSGVAWGIEVQCQTWHIFQQLPQ